MGSKIYGGGSLTQRLPKRNEPVERYRSCAPPPLSWEVGIGGKIHLVLRKKLRDPLHPLAPWPRPDVVQLLGAFRAQLDWIKIRFMSVSLAIH